MTSSDGITVIGAGPAGLACAIALARGGRQVVVREWHGEVGHRFHDDFQGLENWTGAADAMDELAAAGLTADFEHHGVAQGTVYDTRGREHLVQGNRPLFYLLRRGAAPGTLDRALLAQAEAEGVEVRFGDRVMRAEGPSVIATGPRRADVIAVGYLFSAGLPDGAWLVLGDRLAPKGYGYLLVNGGRGTLAACLFRDFSNQARYRDATRAFFEERLGFKMTDPRPFGGFGTVRLPRRATQGGHLLVGERAGFQDALAGFGIRSALRSGLLAAQSILEGSDYDRLWRRDLGPGIARGLVNRALMNRLPGSVVDRGAARLAAGDAGGPLFRLYRAGPVSRTAVPLIARLAPAALPERACGEETCGCVWCKCGGRAAAATAGDMAPSA